MKQYLGDGVWADYDAAIDQLILNTDVAGEHALDRSIVLEAPVFRALIAYLAKENVSSAKSLEAPAYRGLTEVQEGILDVLLKRGADWTAETLKRNWMAGQSGQIDSRNSAGAGLRRLLDIANREATGQ
jgi:hypothetical protein